MRIMTIVGARPQFIKAAALSKILRKNHTEILVHTGQHFDYNMSGIFFEEMGIPKPDYNLGISGGSHAEMTGKMMIEIERVLVKEAPDAVIVFGDTNSTLAAAIAAVKLHFPIIHIEAGNRVGTLNNPEEVNRILTDHVSKIKFACVESGMECLQKENLSENSFLVGDLMYDAFLHYTKIAEEKHKKEIFTLEGEEKKFPEKFLYMTCHRQENTQDSYNLSEILNAANTVGIPVIYPVHPRNKEAVEKIIREQSFDNLIFTAPLGYLDSVYCVNHAEKILTDSGGLQREAFFAGRQCVTVLDFVAWPEIMVGNCNQLAKANCKEILEKLGKPMHRDMTYQPFGDGKSANRICEIIDQMNISGVIPTRN